MFSEGKLNKPNDLPDNNTVEIPSHKLTASIEFNK